MSYRIYKIDWVNHPGGILFQIGDGIVREACTFWWPGTWHYKNSGFNYESTEAFNNKFVNELPKIFIFILEGSSRDDVFERLLAEQFERFL